MPRPPSDTSQNGDQANGPDTPADRPSHPYSPHPQMNGYTGMNRMMDYPPSYPQGPQSYGYKPTYPYYPQQGTRVCVYVCL